MLYISLFVIVFTPVLIFIRRWYTYWERQGLKGPKFFQFSAFMSDFKEYGIQSFEKYGKVFGSYGPMERYLMINDPDLIKEVMQDKFQYCHQRKDINFNGLVKKMFIFMPGDQHWRRLRSCVTPVFTSSNLKKMITHISDVSDNLIANLQVYVNNSQTVDIEHYISGFIVDVLSACAYGIKTESINNPDHPFAVHVNSFFGLKPNLSRIVSVLAPRLAALLNMEFFDSKSIDFFAETTKQIIIKRKTLNNKHIVGETKRTDFIQLILDSENCNHLFDTNSDDLNKQQNRDKNSSKPMDGLSIDEIIAQGILFILAGSDTTSIVLSHLIYYLSKYKDCQQRLYEELKDIKEFSYENLNKLEYLNAVIKETLRMAPPVLVVNRKVNREFELSGIKIPVGTTIQVLPYALHRDPDYWTDPLDFKPERFITSTHNQWVYFPFGGGPRLCVGKAFAMNTLQMCCLKLFSKYELSVSPGFNLEYITGNLLLVPKQVLLNMKER